jgi:hypothetical protein
MCVLGLSLHFVIKRIIFWRKNFKNAIFGAMDNFKQASKQKSILTPGNTKRGCIIVHLTSCLTC